MGGELLLARRRGWAREGLAGIELLDIVEVLELLGRQAAGELVEDLLSNDCVSSVSRRRMR